MRVHHTKTKGDLGVLRAQADLAEQGFGVLIPLTEHEAFDLVAYRRERFYRVQVKYRAAVNGCLDVRFATFWADRNGIHRLDMDKSSVDVMCVYCPDTGRCYYLDPKKHGFAAKLRIAPSKNNQSKGVLWADQFLKFPAP